MRLGSIVIWSFLIVSLLTIGIGSHYHYIQSTEILEEQVVNQLESVAESRANHIETYLEQNI